MVILGSISSWLRRQLKLPEKMTMPHIWTLAALAFVRFFDFRDFCSAPAGQTVCRPTPARTPVGAESYFRTCVPGVRETIQYFWNFEFPTSRSIQKVYMFISLDRTPTGPHQNWWKIIKNHENFNVFDIFRTFRAMASPATSQNNQQCAKYPFFSGNLNWPSNYADLELNPLRLVKSNVWIFQNMQRKNVTTCKVTAWASLQVIQNLFLSAFEIFLATSRCQFTYVWTNFKGSISRFHDDFGVGLIVVAWRIEITRKKYNIAFLEAFNRCFPAHLRFCSATARLQADSSTHQWCTRVAPWVWSCTLRPLTPESPRPRQIFEKSDTGHRDRSKKYICSYLWTAPRPALT